MKDDLFSRISEAIVKIDAQTIAKLTEEVIETGVEPIEAIQKAYMTDILRVRDSFVAGDFCGSSA